MNPSTYGYDVVVLNNGAVETGRMLFDRNIGKHGALVLECSEASSQNLMSILKKSGAVRPVQIHQARPVEISPATNGEAVPVMKVAGQTGRFDSSQENHGNTPKSAESTETIAPNADVETIAPTNEAQPQEVVTEQEQPQEEIPLAQQSLESQDWIPTRTRNAIIKSGISMLGQLVGLRDGPLSDIKGVGDKFVDETSERRAALRAEIFGEETSTLPSVGATFEGGRVTRREDFEDGCLLHLSDGVRVRLDSEGEVVDRVAAPVAGPHPEPVVAPEDSTASTTPETVDPKPTPIDNPLEGLTAQPQTPAATALGGLEAAMGAAQPPTAAPTTSAVSPELAAKVQACSILVEAVQLLRAEANFDLPQVQKYIADNAASLPYMAMIPEGVAPDELIKTIFNMSAAV